MRDGRNALKRSGDVNGAAKKSHSTGKSGSRKPEVLEHKRFRKFCKETVGADSSFVVVDVEVSSKRELYSFRA